MTYKIEFIYDSYRSDDEKYPDDISFERDFELNILEVGSVILTDHEISVLENHKIIELNGTLYNINKLVLKVSSDIERGYTILLNDMNHLPF